MKTIFSLQSSSSQNVAPRAPRVQMNSRRLCKSTFKDFKGQNYFFITLISFSFKTVLACALRVQKQWWIKPSVSNKLLHVILFLTNTQKSECGTKCFLSFVLFTSKPLQENQVPVSYRNVLDDAILLILLILSP